MLTPRKLRELGALHAELRAPLPEPRCPAVGDLREQFRVGGSALLWRRDEDDRRFRSHLEQHWADCWTGHSLLVQVERLANAGVGRSLGRTMRELRGMQFTKNDRRPLSPATPPGLYLGDLKTKPISPKNGSGLRPVPIRRQMAPRW